MSFFNSQRLSCGVVILSPQQELLLCHVTGQNHWDLPKGGIDAGETPLQAALRETFEESGLQLRAEALVELGRFKYTTKKNLHLFATLMPRIDVSQLRCESRYLDHHSGRRLPEMDGYGWFAFARVPALCTPKMATVLGSRIDLGRVWHELAPGSHPQADDVHRRPPPEGFESSGKATSSQGHPQADDVHRRPPPEGLESSGKATSTPAPVLTALQTPVSQPPQQPDAEPFMMLTSA